MKFNLLLFLGLLLFSCGTPIQNYDKSQLQDSPTVESPVQHLEPTVKACGHRAVITQDNIYYRSFFAYRLHLTFDPKELKERLADLYQVVSVRGDEWSKYTIEVRVGNAFDQEEFLEVLEKHVEGYITNTYCVN